MCLSNAEPEKKPLTEQISELEQVPKEERSEVQQVRLDHLHAQKKLHEVTEEKNQIAREHQELKDKKPEAVPEADETFEYLNAEDEKALKHDDPDEHDKYLEEKEGFETRANDRTVNQNQTTMNNIVYFYKEKNGKNGDFDPEKDPAFATWIKSDEFKDLDTYVSKEFKKVNGVHSIAQMKAADKMLNHDSYIADAKVAGRKEAIDDTDPKNFVDGSALDSVPKTDSKRTAKKISDLTEDDMANMGKDQLKQAEEQMKVDAGAT